MEDKRKSLAQLSEFIAANSTQSYENWTHFLRFAGRFYKYSYDEQIGIYLQRPDATAVASYEIWNEKMHRYIKRGSVGIAVLDNSGESVRVRYLFDIADTGTRINSRTPNIWEMRKEHENAIVQDLDRRYGIPDDVGALENHLELLSMQMASAYWEENSAQIAHILDGSGLSVYDTDALGINFRKALSNSVLYLLISRCLGNPDDYLGLEDLSDVADFNTPQAAAALGTAVNTISSEVLRQIERTVRSYDRNQERSTQYEQPTDLHSQRGLSDPEHQTGTHTPDSSEQVRADAPELPEGAESDAVQHSGNAPAAISAPSGDSADRRGAVESDDGGAAGAEPGTGQSAEPDGLGTAHEQPESPGRGSNLPGADLRLIIEAPPFEGEQVSFFASEYEQIQTIDKAERVQAAPSAFSMPQEYIDQFLRYGSNTQNHRMRVAIEYAKQHPQDDLVDFLEKTYHGGYGLQFGGQKVSAWYSEDGMRLSYGSTARYAPNAQILSWENVAVRIGELLEQGRFATNVELAECGTFEKRQLAEQLWYMSRDVSKKAVEAGYMSIVRSLRGGFPEETEKLMNLLSDPQSYQTIMNQVYVFRDACDADKSMMRFQVYNPNKLIRPLEEYPLPRREYVSELAALPPEKGFITEDEINEHLSGRSSRIYAFYQTPHTAKEKLEFLKNEYGISGGNNALSRNFMSDVWTDGRGIRYSKPNCPRIELPWTKVVKYYDALAESGRLIPPKEASQQNQPQEITSDASVEAQPETAEALPAETAEPTSKESAPAEWAYNEIKSAHPDDIVLFQVGDFFEIYGEDAKQAAELLDLNLTTRAIPGAGRIAMCGVPAHNLENYVEELRGKYDVTIAAAPDFRGERRVYTLRSADHEAEAAIDAQEAELGADGTLRYPTVDAPQPTIAELFEQYKLTVGNALVENGAFINACRNSDRENAYLEGAAAIRRIVNASDDLQLTKLYFDMTTFHNRLHQELLDELYPTLATTVTPSPYKVTQADIDEALQQWNGRIESKQAVIRYMAQHGREKDTAAWLAREYGLKDTSKPLQISVGNSEPTLLPWSKVQRRIAQLIKADKFYTQQEHDNFDDIDPIALREALAQRGIVDGRVVDAEANRNSPFVRQVMADVEQIAAQEARMDAPNRFSIRLYPNEGGITGIWDSALDRFYEEDGQVLRFAEQANAIDYLSKIQHRRGIELDAPVFTTPLGIAYRVGDVFSSTAAGQQDTLMVIERVDEDNIWYTLPSVPEQTPVSVDRTTFERYFDTGYFTATEQKEMTIDPAERFHVVELDRGFRTLYAVWDDETHGYYVDSEGVTEEFTSEWQAEAYRLELQGKAEQALMERAKGLISEFCQREYGSEADFSDMAKIGVAYTTITDDEIPIQVNIDLVNYRLERYLDDEHLETRQYSSLQGLIDNELENLDFSDLIHVSGDELESHRWHEPTESEKLNNNPSIRMVMEDVQRISDEEFAKEHLIPGETTFEIDGRTFLVDRVNLDSSSVNFQDITFSNATGFPIFRTESISFVRKYIEEQEKQSIQPVTSAETVAVYPGEKNNLPYDVVVQTLHTEETTPPVQSTPVSIPIDGKWQEFPSVADAEQASYEEYKENLRRNARNFRITDDDLGTGGPKAKFQANMAAIRLLKNLEQEGLQASPEQQEILSRYVGWGGLADAFDESKPTWSGEFAELRSTLTPEEYTAARASTLNAHYTSPTVIRAIYEAIGNMGFRTGNILEPSMGVGNFFGMLPEEMRNSRLYGVELDSISGRIARQLYPQANITIGGFETTERKDFFDLAIGNVPFGQYKVNDPAYNKLGFNIHNYFFAKALDQVRPGGIVAFVTSRYTLDAQNPNVRKYLAQRAELLGAIRLPNTAFKANAGTEVVSDILFLQKRERALDLEPDWVYLGQTEDGFAINSYFLEHPEMVMGKNSSESTAHGIDYTVEPLEDVSLAQQLHEAVQHIQGSYLEAELPDLGDGDVIQDTIPADPDVKNYSYALVDGEVYFRENSVMVRPELSNVAKERVKGMIGLRGCVRALLDLQMNYLTPDADIREKQADLNSLYDGFSKKYGLINSKGNRMAFSDDSSYYLLCSLEVLDEDNKFLRKADMFTKRTIRQARAVTSVDTASEALAVSIAEHACVDMDYMSQLSGKSAADLAAELRGVIFQVPDFSENSIPQYVTADEYLSGNVRKKLAQARQAAQKDAVFQDNVAALEKAQPKDLDASEIDVRLGATWIDKKYIQEFMEELLQPPIYLRQSIQVNYSSYTAEWNITGKKNISFRDVNANTTYGTSRINAYQILQESLNLRDVRVYDTVIDENKNERRVLNQKETTLAQQKQQAIKDAFREWIWKDPQRRQTLVQLYNERYNSDRPREYDGSHINFGGMSPEITLREHQRNAIAHILYGGNTLLAHEVGSGKTFEMVAAAMESRRLGLCSKSMIVVPNHLIEQWASEFLRLYPSANLLVARKKDFEPANRKTFCSKIATGEYDAVIIGHSQFEKIPMSLERQQAVIEQQITEIEEGIEELKASGAERFTVKSMERTRKSLSARLEKLMDGGRKDDVVCFEQLGVDRLFVDEAHGYKNLFLYTKMQNVAGISTTDAQKSSDMYMKCQYLDEKTGGRGVIFATGTPISNSMTELYTMMRYLQSDTLREKGWSHFDCWAAHFGETKTVIELAPEGTGYRARTRFAKFYNLPELINIWKEAADVKTADQLNLPRPEAIYHNEVAKPTQTQKELVQELSQRAAAVHSSRVDSKDDNMLKITSDGRKLGLDQRIINPYLPDEPGTKVNMCVDNVLRIWREGAADKLTQLIFCDISTPKSQAPVRKTLPEQSDFPSTQSTDPLAALNSSDSSFTVYDDIRGKLIAGGIPEEQIAFIHEANTEARKKELFAKVRTGQVRVLMGSTFKMGAGMNVQDRLIALHDLDCPWRPGDLEQRSGRIIRQGNRNKQVHIYRYVTEGTFDSYLWQTVENKQKFISQIMTSKSPVRSCDDVDETALSFAEIKALCAGNPQIKEKMDLDIEVSRLKVLKADHLSQQFRMEDNLLKYFPEQIQKLQSIITGLEADIHLAESHPHPEDGISPMVIDGNALSDKEAAGIALLDAVKKATGLEPVSIGTYRGFHITATLENFGKDRILTLSSALSHQVTLGNDARGNLIRIDNALRELPQQLTTSKNQLENLQSQMEFTKAELGKPFPQEAELAQKSQRLAELNALLDMDGKQTTEQDESKAAPDERPSVLEDLHRRSASIPPHKHSDSRSLEERT